MVKSKKIILSALSVIIAMVVAVIALKGFAIESAGTAVRPTAEETETGTLIIGTHLINLTALYQQLYDTASDSAASSNQEKVYYKSEFTSAWYDITDSSVISDISSDGMPVSNDVIDALVLRYYTKSDGKTYDLETGEAVSVYDIPSAYDLNDMEELEPLRNYYEFVAGSDDSELGKNKLKMMETVLKADITDSVTRECDENLSHLQKYLDVLTANEAPDADIAAVNDVMEIVDAQRRVQVYSILSDLLQKLNVTIGTAGNNPPPVGTEEVQDDGYGEDNQGRFNDISEYANSCVDLVSTTLSEYEAKLLSDGDTITIELQYDYSMGLVSAANRDAHRECDVFVEKLVALDNIINGSVVDIEPELALLNDEILGKVIKRYSVQLYSGESDTYRSTKNDPSQSSAVLANLRKKRLSELAQYLSELETFITAKLDRIKNAEGQDYLNELLSQAAGMGAGIPSDGFSEPANSSLGDYKDWLSKKLSELIAAVTVTEKDTLTDELNGLKTDYMTALDKNDLEGAAVLEEQMKQVSDKLDALDSGNAGALADNKALLDELMSELNSGAESGNGTELLDERNNLMNDLDTLNDRIAQLQEEISDLDADIEWDSNTSGLNDEETDKEELQVIRDDKQIELDDLLGQLSDKQSELDDANDKLVSAAGGDSDLLDKIADVQNQIANLNADLGDGTANLINQLKNEALTEIKSGADADMEVVNGDIDAISELVKSYYPIAFPALTEILEALEKQCAVYGADNMDGAIDAVSDIILDNAAAYEASQRGEVDVNALQDIMDKFFLDNYGMNADTGSGTGDGNENASGLIGADNSENLNSFDRAVIEVLALDMLGSTVDDKKIDGLITKKASAALVSKNQMIFYTLRNSASNFVTVSAAGYLTGMRYSWRSARKIATISRGAEFYTFTQYSASVTTNGDDLEMDQTAQLYSRLYVPASFTEEQFEVMGEGLGNTQFSAAYLEKHSKIAKELYDLLLSAV